MTALAVKKKPEILKMISSGMLLNEVAAKFNVSKQAISKQLKDDPDYHEAMRECSDALIEESKVMTWAARDPVDIARARECAKWAFRYGESINREKWAPHKTMTVEHVGDLGDKLRRAKERVIEGESADVSDRSPVDNLLITQKST